MIKGKLPSKISKYQILGELGRGGMGIVYKAYSPKMNAVIALKILLGKAGEKEVKRFIREAQAMAKLNHPNIIKVHNIKIENGFPYFTMDYIEGISLRKFLQNRPLDVRWFSQLMVKISKAVAYAHQQGVIHRDLKPGNILLDKNFEPYVLDFGLAKFTAGYPLGAPDNSLSSTGTILGTPQYMSPQQAKGEKVNHLADVYALGAIFYEMLLDRYLIEGNNVPAIIYKITFEEPDLLRTVNSNLSKDLEAICHTAVAKDTTKRYQSALKFAQDIERFLQGEIVSARSINIWQRFFYKLQKNKVAIASIVVGFFLIVTGIWLFEKRYSKEVELYIAKAKILHKQAKKSTAIDKKMQKYIETSASLEKALAISSNLSVKNQLIKIREKMGLLAKKQKNYVLSFILFQQCKRLGYKKANQLLRLLEQEKHQQQQKHKKFIAKIMESLFQKATSEALIDRHVFTVVKMQKPYIVKELVPYLKSSNREQRILSIKALGKLGNTYTKFQGKDCVQSLLGSLEKFQDRKTITENQKEIAEIIWALGWLKDARANKRVYELRCLAGESSPLWNTTKIPYKWIPLKEKTLAKDSNSFVLRGRMKQAKGNNISAIADYNQAITLNPKNSEAYNHRATIYKNLKNYAKAIADYNKAIALTPTYSVVYNNRGILFIELKTYTKALADFNKAEVLNSKDPLVYLNRGNTYCELRKYARAIEDYNKAIALDPKYSLAYNNRGLAYQDLKNYAKAIMDYNQAIAFHPKYAVAYLNRGNTYLYQRKYTKAIADYDKAINFNPKYSRAYNSRASAYLYLNEYAKSVVDYSKAIALNPKYLNAYSNRAYAYQCLKEYAKAIVDLTKIIALNPRGFSTYADRGKLYLSLKQHQRAYKDFQIFLKRAPNHSMAPKIRAIVKNLRENN